MKKKLHKFDKLIFYFIGSVILVFILLGVVFLSPQLNFGEEIRLENPNKQFREDFTTTMSSFAGTIELITAAFGVIAFLVTYQQKQGNSLPKRAWGILISSVIVLSGGLLLCMFGKELMLKMLAENLVSLDYWPLIYSRWGAYGCLVISAALISFFTLELANNSGKLPVLDKEFD
jgi:hypothetical protein